MIKWEEIVKRYTIKQYNLIKKITTPLKDHFSISSFFYIKINYQGQFIWFGNRPDCAEYYVDQKHYINDPCMSYPNNWSSGFSLLETSAPDNYQDTFIKYLILIHGLFLVIKMQNLLSFSASLQKKKNT